MKKLKIGVAGLGRAFAVTAPAFRDRARRSRRRRRSPHGGAADNSKRISTRKAYATVEDLCADPAVEVVYVATPHQFHAAHTRLACSHGKHVLVEKPMALALEDCRSMIDAARKAGVQLIVGHSHSFDLPILKTRELDPKRRLRCGAHDHGARLHRLPLPSRGGRRSSPPSRAAARCSTRPRTRSTSCDCSPAAR